MRGDAHLHLADPRLYLLCAVRVCAQQPARHDRALVLRRAVACPARDRGSGRLWCRAGAWRAGDDAAVVAPTPLGPAPVAHTACADPDRTRCGDTDAVGPGDGPTAARRAVARAWTSICNGC